MLKGDFTSADSHSKATLQNLDEQSEKSMKGLGNLVERIAPTLLDVGSWIFGGLIALNLVVIGALITVGPVDTAILISTTVLGCALPLNVAGLFLLRLIKDMKDIRIDDLALQAFQEADFPNIDAYFPASEDRVPLTRRRFNIVLLYSLGIIALSIALTGTGLVAALWHMAWWIGVSVLALIILSTVLVIVVLAYSLPKESEAEKELKKLYLRQNRRNRNE